MHTLRRTVRFIINPASAGTSQSITPKKPRNTYAGAPGMQGLGRYYEMILACEGAPDPITAYLIDIKDCDKAVREAFVPLVNHACQHDPTIDPSLLLAQGFSALQRAVESRAPGLLPVRLASVCWFLTPTYSVEIQPAKNAITTIASGETPLATSAILRQRFDLAAAHRLHVPGFTPEHNRALFGKCNNPNGHGHNYQFEPAVVIPIGVPNTPAFSLADLEAAADTAIVSRFDHTHLNLDTTEFAEDVGLNPSVENIAMVFYRRLEAELKASHPTVHLQSLTVWETDRTSATFAP